MDDEIRDAIGDLQDDISETQEELQKAEAELARLESILQRFNEGAEKGSKWVPYKDLGYHPSYPFLAKKSIFQPYSDNGVDLVCSSTEWLIGYTYDYDGNPPPDLEVWV